MNKPASRLSRLLQIRRVIKKYGLNSLVDELGLSAKAKLGARLLFGSPSSSTLAEPLGVRIRQALEELGPVFVKLGQALSTRPDLLPEDISAELTKLQDQVPPFPANESLKIIHDAYEEQVDDIFSSIEAEPLASASVAQVHLATLNQGLAITGQNGKASEQVIIKVLRPGIVEVVESDLRVMYTFAGLLQKYWKRGAQFKPLDVIKEYDHTIHDELDLRTEAANGARMGADFEDTDIIYVPRIYWDYTKQNVLVMERIFGTSIREFGALEDKGFDLKALAEDGVEVFFKQAFEYNFFHADMHAGNIFVSDKGKWIAIDFGIMGTLTDQDKQYLAEMLLGFFNRDYHSIAEAHLRAGWIPADTRVDEFEQAIRVVCEPIFAKPLSQISFGNVLMQLFQTVRRFEMPVQPQLVLLYKTLLNIEGLGRQLYPDLNLWDTAKPFLEGWMKKQLSPQALIDDLKRDWPKWRELITKLPDALNNKAALEPVQKTTKPGVVSGLSIAGLGALGSLSAQYGLVENPTVSQTSPWLVVAGLILAMLKR